jgi:hypothetical protein
MITPTPNGHRNGHVNGFPQHKANLNGSGHVRRSILDDYDETDPSDPAHPEHEKYCQQLGRELEKKRAEDNKKAQAAANARDLRQKAACLRYPKLSPTWALDRYNRDEARRAAAEKENEARRQRYEELGKADWGTLAATVDRRGAPWYDRHQPHVPVTLSIHEMRGLTGRQKHLTNAARYIARQSGGQVTLQKMAVGTGYKRYLIKEWITGKGPLAPYFRPVPNRRQCYWFRPTTDLNWKEVPTLAGKYEEPYASVPLVIAQAGTLTPLQLAVYAILRYKTGRSEVDEEDPDCKVARCGCYASIRELMRQTGVEEHMTMIRALRRLVELKLIECVQPEEEGAEVGLYRGQQPAWYYTRGLVGNPNFEVA